MKKIVKISLILSLIITLAFSCDPMNTDKTVEITSIGWIYENISTGYWTDGFNSATMFFTPGIVFSGDTLYPEDIKEAGFTANGLTWDFDINSNTLDSVDSYLDGDRYYTTDFPYSGAAMPVGDIEFFITLENGNLSTYSFSAPVPGSTIANGKTHLYNEDFTNSTPSTYVQMIPRATLGTNTKNASTITLDFTVNDSNVFSGFVWFYNSDKSEYIGRTEYFVDYNSGAVNSIINTNTGLNNNSTNTVTVTSGNIKYSSSTSLTFSDIDKYHVILTDGQQYSGSSWTYDNRSISDTGDLP